MPARTAPRPQRPLTTWCRRLTGHSCARHAECTWQGMRLRLAAGYGVLALVFGVACGGRADLFSLAGPVHEGGAPRSSTPETRATQDAGSTPDASVTDATTAIEFDAGCSGGSMIVDLGNGALCDVPSNAALEGTGCFLFLPPASGCAPSEYKINCGAAAFCSLNLDPRCTGSSEMSSGGSFCCPCGGPAGSPEADPLEPASSNGGVGGCCCGSHPPPACLACPCPSNPR